MARRVCSEERVWIEVLSAEGLSDAQIAKRLGRDRATVWRERRRCGGGDYCARRAQAGADARAARPRPSKLAADAVLGWEVQQRLDERLSPHAVSAELAEMGMFVCAETIYQACYDPAALSGLEAGTWNKLPRARRRRKPRSRCEQARRSPLGDYRPIAERPETAEGRDEPGHWEGDLITGKANRSAVATLVERSSRHTLVVGLAGGYDAQSTARAVAAALARQPAAMLKTLTWDQGTEMAKWAHIEKTAGIEVYFCEPRSPWQRPTNEQTNGILRRWLPKGTDLDIGAARLAVIEDRINTMPRKLHNWNSAQTIYNDLCRDHH
ncbi:MAG: IS30 family transposase [Acidimicrobiia bacterium]|nr:IS30 family transposase [Acidimicrobiia bacterium]MCY4433791.1 IS30 family transposase [bacterium]